ncbi:MAG: GNAT family N-acetyltransferase [Salinibacterium sp.]|nr:GNAT family N-acetyltransferase [Salinibacterium sp.]
MTEPSSAPIGTPEVESPAFSVRRADATDAAALAAVAAETFPLACPPDTLPESIAAFIAAHLSVSSFSAYLDDPERALFLAEADPGSGRTAEAAGYTMIVFGEPADADAAAAVTTRPTAELSKVYVRQMFHGAGLARLLVAASVDEAHRRGAVSVWLGVNQANERANRFYGKQGFDLVGSKRFRLGERYEEDFVRARVL